MKRAAEQPRPTSKPDEANEVRRTLMDLVERAQELPKEPRRPR